MSGPEVSLLYLSKSEGTRVKLNQLQISSEVRQDLATMSFAWFETDVFAFAYACKKGGSVILQDAMIGFG